MYIHFASRGVETREPRRNRRWMIAIMAPSGCSNMNESEVS